MNISNKLIIIITLGTILFASNCLAVTEEKDIVKKAHQYFEDQLNFTTNANGVKNVVDGKITNVKIIDVRAEKHFKISRIPGSINVPFDKFKTFTGDEKHFSGLTKEGYNYVLCYEENCNLSQKACRKFSSLGYKVKEVKGGFQSYIDHNYPVDNNKL